MILCSGSIFCTAFGGNLLFRAGIFVAALPKTGLQLQRADRGACSGYLYGVLRGEQRGSEQSSRPAGGPQLLYGPRHVYI